MLEILLGNLLSNAQRYSLPDSIIKVSVCAAIGIGEIYISNLAPHLSADDIPLMTQRFWRKQHGGGATADAGAYCGLGLALCESVAAAMGLRFTLSLEAGVFTACVES